MSVDLESLDGMIVIGRTKFEDVHCFLKATADDTLRLYVNMCQTSSRQTLAFQR